MVKELRRRVWNWLPTFLEIAETGSVVAASRSLHLTPAAVSRTLGLLESELGQAVFNRVGRSLVLNQHGHSLRDALQAAVSSIDRGLSHLQLDPFDTPLRVSSLGVLTETLVIPMLIEQRRQHPQLVAEHLNLRTAEATEMLARGAIDLAFYYEERAVDGIVVKRLGETPTSVYCGKGHPLFSAKRVTRSAVLEHPFSIPQLGDSGRVMDGWPTDLPRKVAMRITMLRSNLEICRSGVLLTVLPDIVAHDYRVTGELRRLPSCKLPNIEVFAAQPAAGLRHGPANALIHAVQMRLQACNRRLRQ